MLSIHTNYTSLLTQNNLNKTSGAMDQAMQRISTGFRINSASDDAAGLQIATRLQSQVNGLNVASRNAQDSISMLQTAEGAFDEMTNIGHRMKDLATQAANGTNSASEHEAMQAEWDQLVGELDSIIANTQYGSGNNLFGEDGQFDGVITFQIGATTNETLTVDISAGLEGVREAITGLGHLTMATTPDTSVGLAVGENGDEVFTYAGVDAASGWHEAAAGDIAKLGYDGPAFGSDDWDDLVDDAADDTSDTQAQSQAMIDAYNSAAESVFDSQLERVQYEAGSGAADAMDGVDALLSGGTFTYEDADGEEVTVTTGGIGAIRSELGATINRLDHTIINLGNMAENTEMAKGRIMDTDYAVESSEMMKNQMLTQMSMSMLSQANGMSGMVMSLI